MWLKEIHQILRVGGERVEYFKDYFVSDFRIFCTVMTSLYIMESGEENKWCLLTYTLLGVE